MADITITVTHTARLRPEAFGFAAEEMREIAAAGLPFERLDVGLNRFDQPMEPLGQAYARRKQRRGLRPIRDIRFSGATRQAIEVEAQADHAVIEVRGDTRVWRRAYFNQLRSGWFGLAPSDAGRMDDVIGRVHEVHMAEAFE